MQCIVEGCEQQAVARGLCQACKMYAIRLIQAGETTWEALEAAKRCLPARDSAKKRQRWFTGVKS